MLGLKGMYRVPSQRRFARVHVEGRAESLQVSGLSVISIHRAHKRNGRRIDADDRRPLASLRAMRRGTGTGLRVGDVAAMPLPLGGYGACQVTSIDHRSVMVCALAWHSEPVPTVEELAAARPLYLSHHAHEDGLAHIAIDGSHALPEDFHWLGCLPVHPDVPDDTSSLSRWEYLPAQVMWQRRWDLQLPAAAKAAYKSAGADLASQVPVDFGGGVSKLPLGTAHLDLRSAVPVPSAGPVRWAALDALPRLTGLSWSGQERGLLAALAARPMISDLYWQDPPASIDLGSTGLTEVSVSGDGLSMLRLPEGLIDLRLSDAADTSPDVEAAGDGRWIQLTLESPRPAVPPGLTGVRHLGLRVQGEVMLSPLRTLTDLNSLRIRWAGPPGRLADPGVLTAFEHLDTVELIDAYALAAADLPGPDTWSLRHLEIDGIRKSEADALRARYRKSSTRLSLRGAKSDVWLAANLTNPFRDWVDDDRSAGAAACKAYTDALYVIDRVPADAGDRAGTVGDSLRMLVEKLNTIDARHEFIDTLRREEAGDAFMNLAERAGVPGDVASDWFDEWREF